MLFDHCLSSALLPVYGRVNPGACTVSSLSTVAVTLETGVFTVGSVSISPVAGNAVG